MKKTTLLVIVVLLLGAAATGLWYKYGNVKKVDAAASTVRVKVEKGSIRLTVPTNGKVVSNQDVDIKCKASGQVKDLPFDVSDKVKKDDLLVGLDPVDEQRLLDQATVTLSASEAKLAIAQQNLNIATRTLVTDKLRAKSAIEAATVHLTDAQNKAARKKVLLDKGLGVLEDYETAATTVAQAKVDLDNAKTKLEELETQEIALELQRQQVKLAQAEVQSDNITLSITHDRVRDTRVLSPMDAVVSAVNVQKGTMVSSGVSNVGGGTTVLSLSDLSRIFVLASVDESDIGKVNVGQAASIWSDSYPGVAFPGKVVRIATKGVNVSNVVTFEVKIEVLSDQKNLLKPEMTTTVEIVTDERNDILLVPIEAVARKGSRIFVSVASGDNATTDRTVKLGVMDTLKAEVVEGLNEGDTVVYQKGAAGSKWSSGSRSGAPPIMMGAPGKRGG